MPDQLQVTVTGLSVRSFVNKDVVSVGLSVRNSGSAQERFTSGNLRLVTGGGVEPTSDDFDLLIPADAAATDSARFELPPGSRDAVLRITVGEMEDSVRLDLRSRQR